MNLKINLIRLLSNHLKINANKIKHKMVALKLDLSKINCIIL